MKINVVFKNCSVVGGKVIDAIDWNFASTNQYCQQNKELCITIKKKDNGLVIIPISQIECIETFSDETDK